MSVDRTTATIPADRRSVGWGLVVGAAVVAVAVVIWQITVIPHGNPFYGLFHNMTDLKVYRAGAGTVLHESSLYQHAVWAHLEFTYPPFAAVVFVPFAVMPLSAAKVVWWVGIYLALVAVVILGFRSLGYRADRRLWLFALCAGVAVTALEPVRTTIWLGQINIFLMLIVLADLVFCDLRRPRSWLRGAGVGIAAGLKLTPAFMVVYLLAVRRFRAAAVAVVAFVATVVVGFIVIPGDSRDYWGDYVGGASRVGRVDSPANQSINGFISQLLAYFDISRFRQPYPDGGTVYEAPAWLWMPIAVIAAVLGLWAAVVAYRRQWRLLSVTIAAMTGAAVSPFSWGHHWVWFVPLLVVAVEAAYRGTRAHRGRWWWWLGPVGIVVCSFAWSYNWWNSGPYRASDHAIAIGVFMMPRWADVHWYDSLAVVVYSGAYPAVLLGTIIVTLVVAHRGASGRVGAESGEAPKPDATDDPGRYPGDPTATQEDSRQCGPGNDSGSGRANAATSSGAILG
ncbi:glycosyltransferase 87 family protein [Gordonia sp. VNK1]|uniref:glycosyltransferase 87 family protein n=1 Tax=Gordonia oleivorans TaxID=3156618 RepID=UPI0032B48ED8